MKAHKVLDKIGVDYELVEQDNPTKDCDAAAKERGIETCQIVKSLLIERDGKKLHVCIPGDRKLSEKKFGEHRLLPPEQSEKITGFESGTVHPLSSNLEHFVDERVFENSKVSFTIGETLRGLIISSEDFKKALQNQDFNLKVQDIVSTGRSEIEQIKEQGLSKEEANFIVKNGYRKRFLELKESYSSQDILTVTKKLHREIPEFTKDQAANILDRAENETHIQKLVEHLSSKGELPKENSFSLEDTVGKVVEEKPGAVKDYREGNNSSLNYLIGQVMQRTQGRADAEKTRELLLDRLED